MSDLYTALVRAEAASRAITEAMQSRKRRTFPKPTPQPLSHQMAHRLAKRIVEGKPYDDLLDPDNKWW